MLATALLRILRHVCNKATCRLACQAWQAALQPDTVYLTVRRWLHQELWPWPHAGWLPQLQWLWYWPAS